MTSGFRWLVAIGVVALMAVGGVLATGAGRTGGGEAPVPRAWVPDDTDWPQFRHDAARGGLTSANATMRFAYFKWAARAAGPVQSSPAVATLLATGNSTDVVVGSSDGRLYCVNGMTGVVRWRFQAGNMIFSSPAIGDIDGDGRPEVAFGSNDGRIYALNGEDGTLAWRYTTRAPVWGSPALVDLDADGLSEVVVGGYDGRVYAILGNGSLLWSSQTTLAEGDIGIEASPAVGDINGDGAPEVVVPAGDWTLHALKGADGSKVWTHQLGTPYTGSSFPSTPLLADLDLDGQVEVVVGNIAGTLFCLDGRDGSEKWTRPDLGAFHTSPAAAHVDFDGSMEIFASFDNGSVSSMACLDGRTGELEWTRSFVNITRSSPALADVDGDGGLEVVFGAHDRVLRALDAESGTPSLAFPCMRGINSSPAVADIDRDGKAEIVFGCNDGRLYAVDYNL